jgi:hypothetical protein
MYTAIFINATPAYNESHLYTYPEEQWQNIVKKLYIKYVFYHVNDILICRT